MKFIEKINTFLFIVEYGPALIEHVFLLNGFKNSTRIGKDFNIETDVEKLSIAILQAEDIMNKARTVSMQVML